MENNTNIPAKPNNYLVWAILSTVFCCLVTGIVSIVYSSKVNEAYAGGNYEEAIKASKTAKMWLFIGLGISLLFWVVYIAIFGLAFFVAMSNGDF